MKPASWTIGLLLLLLPLWGCGDDYCTDFDSPTAATCEVTDDCSEIDCGGICGAIGSAERGAVFCENSVCTCPCRACYPTGI